MIKKLCQRCKNENGMWHEPLDSLFWEKEIIICPSGHTQKISEPPPKGCPYALEHTVLNEDEE